MGKFVIDIVVSNCIIIDATKLKELNRIVFKNIIRIFTYKNPKYIENEKWGYSNSYPTVTPKNLMSYELDEETDTLYISRGGLKIVLKELDKFDIEARIVDRTLVCDPIDFSQSRVTRRKDQQLFITKMLRHTQGCGQAPTSFGKTLMSLELAREIGQPVLVLVHSTFIQEQWIEEAINPNTFNMNPKHIGGVGGLFSKKSAFHAALGHNVNYEKRKYGKVNICLYHSMAKENHMDFFKDRIGLVLFDEGQKSPISDIQTIVNTTRARYRYTVSANFERKDGKEFLTFDTFGEVIATVKETNTDSKIIARVNIVKSKYEDLNYSDNDHEDYKNFSKMLTVMARDRVRNILICRLVIRRVRQGKTCIIFVQRKEHAGILAKMLSKFRVELLIGSTSKQDIADMKSPSVRAILKGYDHTSAFKTIKRLAEVKELDITIGTQKSEVGLNVRAFDYGLIATPIANEERLHQIKGRIERTYSSEQVKLFGHKKQVPILEVLHDVGLSPSNNMKDAIIDKYGKLVKLIKLKEKPKTILRRKNG